MGPAGAGVSPRERRVPRCGRRAAGGLCHVWGSRLGLSPAEKASATEARYNKLKEKHSELINTHAELLRKVGSRPALWRQSWPGGGESPVVAEHEPIPRLCRTQTQPSS